jgi:hypothetical protein
MANVKEPVILLDRAWISPYVANSCAVNETRLGS